MNIIELRKRSIESWTLREVIPEGTLIFECRKCWRLAAVDALHMVERFGADATVAIVRSHMVCRVCGTHRPRPLMRVTRWRGDDAWLPVPPRARR